MPTVWLPLIANASTVISGTGEASGFAYQLFELMRLDPAQKRPSCIWHPLLATCAQTKCERMAHEGWADHVDPSGTGPNKMVRDAGYPLPEWYRSEPSANSIESLIWNFMDSLATALNVWNYWLTSPHHKSHLLGETVVFAAQTNVGVGMVFDPQSKYRWYFAVISAPPMEGS